MKHTERLMAISDIESKKDSILDLLLKYKDIRLSDEIINQLHIDLVNHLEKDKRIEFKYYLLIREMYVYCETTAQADQFLNWGSRNNRCWTTGEPFDHHILKHDYAKRYFCVCNGTFADSIYLEQNNIPWIPFEEAVVK